MAINYSWYSIGYFRTITFSMLGVLYYWYNAWRDYLLYIAIIPMAATLVVSLFFLVEGPSYLYRKHRIE